MEATWRDELREKGVEGRLDQETDAGDMARTL